MSQLNLFQDHLRSQNPTWNKNSLNELKMISENEGEIII